MTDVLKAGEESIEDQAFFREYIQRRDALIASTKTVLGDVGVDRLWEMYADAAIAVEDYRAELTELYKKIERFDRIANIVDLPCDRHSPREKVGLIEVFSEAGDVVAKSYSDANKLARSATAARGGKAKVANNPDKKNALNEVYKEWLKVNHKIRYKADFGRMMHKKFPVLESPKYIEDMCRKWEKEKPKKV